MKKYFSLFLLLTSLTLGSFAQSSDEARNKRDRYQKRAKAEDISYFSATNKSSYRAIECMPEATYSNTPTDFYSGVNSNTEIGYRVAQRVVGFDYPVEAIRFFGIQVFYNGLFWEPENEADPINFEIKFYDDDNGAPGSELVGLSQNIALKHNNTGEVFDFDFFVFHWDFIPEAPIMGLPEIFWVSIANTDTDVWFLWLDQPGGLDYAMQLEESSGIWEPNIYPAGICLVPTLSEPESPAKPESLTVNVADLGELSATISWTNPNNTFDGDNLTDLTKITLEVNDVVEHEINNPIIGGSETYTYTAIESGLYKFSVYGTNAVGDGPKATQIVWVGNDVPAAPQNVTLTAIENGGHIQWEAPTTGLHNGYIEVSETQYKVIRLPNTIIAEGISVTEVTDIFEPNIGEYQYLVMASNSFGEGGQTNSNFALLGGEGVLLYETFKSVSVGDLPAGWVIEDQQGGWATQKTKFAGGESPEMQLFWEPPIFGKTRLASHSFSVEDIESVRWSFLHMFDVFGMGATGSLAAQYSLDNGTWTNVWSRNISSSISSELLEFTINIPAGTSQMRVAWEFDGDSFDIDGWYIDNVVVEPVLDNDLRALTISGDQTPEVGQTAYYSVTVENVGNLSQSNYTVKLMNEGGIELGSVDGVALEPTENESFTFTWTPQAGDEGMNRLYGEVIFTDDENNRNNKTRNLNVVVQPEGVAVVSVGTGNIVPELTRLPFDFYWMNSLSQTMYRAEEINLAGSVLSSVGYTNSFTSNLLEKEVRIWMGETTDNDLESGWIPLPEMTLVYEGPVDFPSGKNSVIIPLDNPYIYGGGNLVIYTNRVWEEHRGLMVDNFVCSQELETPRSLYQFSDAETPMDPANPGEFYVSDYYPNIKLFFNTDGLGTLNGSVTHDSEPIEGAVVKVEGTTLMATTNAQGAYSFPYVMPGTWSISYETFGYHTVVANNIVIDANETTTHNVELIPMSTYTVMGTVKGNDNVMLQSANVSLDGYDFYSVITNSDGSFTFQDVYEGVYEITIQADGYTTLTQENIGIDDMEADEGIIELGEFELNENIVAPHNLSVVLNPNNVDDVLFSWEHNINDGAKTFNGFNVYLDDVLVNTTPIFAMQYNFQGLDLNVEYKAGVQSVYNTDTSEQIDITFTTLKHSKVKGVVKNILGVLEGVEVTLGDMVETTNSEGRFEFTQVLVDTYLLTVSYPSYSVHTQEVNVLGSDVDLGEIVLDEIITNPYGLLIEMQPQADKVNFSWNNAFGFEDDFESYEDFIIENIGDYTLYDGDGSHTYGFEQASFPNSGYTGSYIIFNPSQTTPAIGSPDILPYSGDKYIACFAAIEGSNFDWLITPPVDVSSNMTFSFWGKTYMPDYGLERFKVAVSTTNTDVESFQFITDVIQVSPLWSKYEYDLSAFEGEQVYIALVCVSDQAFIFMVDDMAVSVDMKNRTEVLAYTTPTMSQLVNAQNSREVVGYNVYLDDVLVTESPIAQEEFMFTNLEPNKTYVAGVQGVFETGSTDIEVIVFTTLDGTGISAGLLEGITLYPNPFNQEIWVSRSDLVKRIIITNAIGQTVIDQILNGDEFISTSSLTQGVYLITLEGFDGERVVRKMIKQ